MGVDNNLVRGSIKKVVFQEGATWLHLPLSFREFHACPPAADTLPGLPDAGPDSQNGSVAKFTTRKRDNRADGEFRRVVSTLYQAMHPAGAHVPRETRAERIREGLAGLDKLAEDHHV